MSITNLLAQGFNPLPSEIQQNALMAGQQMQERRMRNALLQQQMQAAQEERAAQQRNALMADQRAQDRAQYLGSLDTSAGPARPLDPARALMLGFKPEEIKTLQGPAPAAPMRPLVLPDGTVLSGDGSKVIRAAAPTATAKIGAINPESWTPASVAEYQKTGNPAVLRRYVPPQSSQPGGAPQGGKPPAGYRYKPDGTLEPIPGGPAAGVKGLTEAQAKATSFLGQMRAAEETLGQIGPNQVNLVEQTNVAMAGTPLNILASKKAQQIRQAQEQWAEAFLRFKTGAAATEAEVKRNVATFFPKMGDSQEVIDQKMRMREQAVADIAIVAGSGAERAQVVPSIAERSAAPKPAANAPQPGTVDGGYRFKGGNPSDPKNWEKVQ